MCLVFVSVLHCMLSGCIHEIVCVFLQMVVDGSPLVKNVSE